MIEENLKDSLEDLSEPGSIMGGEGANPMIGIELNQGLLDSIGTKATSSKFEQTWLNYGRRGS